MLDLKMIWKANVSTMLESIRLSFIGKLQAPHSHFIAKGSHAITLETHQTKASKNETLAEMTED